MRADSGVDFDITHKLSLRSAGGLNMDQITIAMWAIVILASGTWFQYRLSGRRAYKPLWVAFTTTGAALLFLVAGVRLHAE